MIYGKVIYAALVAAWIIPHESNGTVQQCSALRFDGFKLEWTRFLTEVLPLQKPLIIERLIDTWPSRRREKYANTKAFVDAFGEHQAGLTSTTENRTFTTVSSYFSQLPEERNGAETFDQLFLGQADSGPQPIFKALRAAWSVPDILDSVGTRPIFSVGRNISGSMVHRHGLAWLGLSQGQKRWLLRPPGSALDVERFEGDRTAKSWRSTDPCKLSYDEFEVCDQRAGEVFVLPDGWWHGTCNFGEFNLAFGRQARWDDLHEAALDGNLHALESIASIHSAGGARALQITLDQPNDLQSTALHLAALGGHLAVTSFLVQNGASLKAADSFGEVPLHKAARHGHAAVCQRLLEAAADIRASGFDGSTALHFAITAGHVDVAEVLAKGGADASALSSKVRDGLNDKQKAVTRFLEERVEAKGPEL